MNATNAADVANANPGSQLQIHWVGGATGDSDVCTLLSILSKETKVLGSGLTTLVLS